MFFIFLNSIFTCFIAKFASFFGLKQIFLLCPKLDCIFLPLPKPRKQTHLQRAAMSRPCGGASESQFLQNAREVIIRVDELVCGVFGSRGEKRYWFRVLLLLREALGRKTLP
ncbi:hypothetical protein HID58_029387 [Brassica napus]|uniref:Uncharacterized protein n=1 Tax=Brassica napus TaxID=3708 RepID=A0ABQ8CCX9_BRANA|nr:hypothetical protein HID58_029387 [Brassica napus]